MKKEDIFWFIVFITIIITRAGVMLFPNKNIYFFGLLVHHFWAGIFLIIISLLIHKSNLLKLFLYSIGTGLVVDQLVFIILGAGGDAEYWANLSVYGTLLVLFIVYMARKKMVV